MAIAKNKVIRGGKDLRADYTKKYGFSMPDSSVKQMPAGLSAAVVTEISREKKEPQWMLNFRLNALELFEKIPMPTWGPDLSSIDFNSIVYYRKPEASGKRNWQDVPEQVKKTFDRLGVPKAERAFLAGVEAQYDSEVSYSSLKEELQESGIIFCSTDEAVKRYPEILKEYFSKLVPPGDNKFAALNSAVWSGGSFVYIPKGVKVKRPLQAYFRINAQRMGQFERTLIIAEEGSFVHYTEGCTAPVYSSNSLHAAVVEVFVKPGARVRYSTIQNWSTDVFNLVTKRSRVEKNAIMEWVDGNLGSKTTMKYPCCVLAGENAHGEVLSLAYASAGMHQDAGAKMIHLAPNTTSSIISKSISAFGGRTSYRGLVQINPSAPNSSSHVECDALILDGKSASDTFPVMRVNESTAKVEHEATVSKIGEEKLFYLMSRGLTQSEAMGMIVSGFIEPIVKELPMEYAVELNRLVEMEMEGSVG
jgi:Fe-S cluster assembly protein SufB